MTYADLINADTPLLYHRMETTAAHDEVSNTNKTLVGTPTVGAGKWDNGWTVNQNVAINLGGTFTDFTSDGSFSIEAWFKLPTTYTASYPTIWRRDGNGIALLLRARSNTFGTGLGPGCLEVYLNGTAFYSPGRYDDNLWHHVVMAVNGGTVKLYVDGTQVYSTACGTGWVLSSGSGSQALCAGGTDPTNGEGWQGGMDEVAIYSYALSPTQVTNHYTYAPPVTYKGWGLPL